MTITLLAPDGVAVTAQQERQARAAGHGGGSGRQLGGRSGFRVGTPSTVLAATGTTWTLGPCAAMLDPGASTHQGMYGWSSDANVTGAVTAADATNPRKDIVYIQVNDSSAGDGSGAVTANVLYLAGTPGVTPSAPTLPVRSFLVGTISVPVAGGGSPTVALNPARYVAAGAPLPVSSVTERDALTKYDGLIVQRLDLPGRPTQTHEGAAWGALVGARQYAELVSTAPFDIFGSNQLWDVGPLTVDSSSSVNASFVNTTAAPSGAFNITEDGVYSITSNTIGNGSPGNGWVSMRRGASEIIVTGSTNGYAWEISTAATVFIAAGTYIRLRAQTTNAVSSAITRIRLTKVQG